MFSTDLSDAVAAFAQSAVGVPERRLPERVSQPGSPLALNVGDGVPVATTV
jgi:hypothetical protein